MPPDACAEARARSKKALQRAAIRSEPVLDEASFARQVLEEQASVEASITVLCFCIPVRTGSGYHSCATIP